MKEATLYQKLSGKKVRCLACQRKCTIDNGSVGFCLAKKNAEGKLYSLLYGQTTGIQIDPIEKKPFYHFKPGSTVATIGSIGCNFHCKQCLNSWCTWGPSATETLHNLFSQKQVNHSAIHELSPKQIVKQVVKTGQLGIAFSYNEPVIWAEFARDIAEEFKSHTTIPKIHRASQQNTKYKIQNTKYSVFVTNGSWTKETIDLLSSPSPLTPDTSTEFISSELERLSASSQTTTHPHPLIDAANIDFKGFSDKTYQKMEALFGKIPEMAVYAQKRKIFLEITTLLIPTINDNWEEIKEMTNFIVHKLGPNTPWHLSEYDPKLSPDEKFQQIPYTPPESLLKAAEIGKNEGLNHVYIWAPHSGLSVSDTICPKCKKVVIKRDGWVPTEINLTPDAKCRFCGNKSNIIL